MNKIAPITYSEEDMLSILDGQIDQTVSAGKSVRAAITPFLNMLLHDSALQRSFVAWAIDARVEQRNSGASGQEAGAHNGHYGRAAAPETNSDDSGHGLVAAMRGRPSNAMSSLPNEDDAGEIQPACCQQNVEIVGNGPYQRVPSPSLNGDGVGQLPSAANSSPVVSAAPSPTHRDADGHRWIGRDALKSHAVPYREPSGAELKGRLSAKFRVAERILTSLDTYVINGKAIGDLSFAEARAALDDKVEKSAVLRQVLRHAANVAPNQLVRDVVKPADLDDMIRKAKELVDVA